MPQKDIDRLGTDKVGKLLFAYSMPAIMGMLVNTLYNTLDRIYIRQAVDPLGQYFQYNLAKDAKMK